MKLTRIILSRVQIKPEAMESSHKREILALVLTDKNRASLKEYPMPVMKQDEVLIKMNYVCISRQDVHLSTLGSYRGINLFRDRHVLGSMGSGTIAKVGSEVYGGLKEGDKVAIEPVIFCGECMPCTKRRYNICTRLMVTGLPPRDGLLRTYYTHPWKLCHQLPEKVSTLNGAYCSLIANSIHAYVESEASALSNIVILGMGNQGAGIAMVFRKYGVKSIVAIDYKMDHLSLAKNIGVDYLIHTKQIYPPLDVIADIVSYCQKGESTDIVVDTVHSWGSARMAVKLLKVGGTVVLLDIPSIPSGFNCIQAYDEAQKDYKIKEVFGYGEQFKNAIAFLATEKPANLIPPYIISMKKVLDGFTMARGKIVPKVCFMIDCDA